MTRVEYSTVIDAQADRVWSVIRDFGGLAQWFPFVSACVLEDGAAPDQVGAVRANTVQDGVVREQLLEMSDQDRRIVYSVLDGPVPTRDYVARLQVHPVTDGDRSFVFWSAEFEVDGDAAAVAEWVREGIFATCLAELASVVSPAPVG
jgi:uncharacterized protein YndB with AHSA1/START domain